jgi:hypothetical protein
MKNVFMFDMQFERLCVNKLYYMLTSFTFDSLGIGQHASDPGGLISGDSSPCQHKPSSGHHCSDPCECSRFGEHDLKTGAHGVSPHAPQFDEPQKMELLNSKLAEMLSGGLISGHEGAQSSVDGHPSIDTAESLSSSLHCGHAEECVSKLSSPTAGPFHPPTTSPMPEKRICQLKSLPMREMPTVADCSALPASRDDAFSGSTSSLQSSTTPTTPPKSTVLFSAGSDSESKLEGLKPDKLMSVSLKSATASSTGGAAKTKKVPLSVRVMRYLENRSRRPANLPLPSKQSPLRQMSLGDKPETLLSSTCEILNFCDRLRTGKIPQLPFLRKNENCLIVRDTNCTMMYAVPTSTIAAEIACFPYVEGYMRSTVYEGILMMNEKTGLYHVDQYSCIGKIRSSPLNESIMGDTFRRTLESRIGEPIHFLVVDKSLTLASEAVVPIDWLLANIGSSRHKAVRPTQTLSDPKLRVRSSGIASAPTGHHAPTKTAYNSFFAPKSRWPFGSMDCRSYDFNDFDSSDFHRSSKKHRDPLGDDPFGDGGPSCFDGEGDDECDSYRPLGGNKFACIDVGSGMRVPRATSPTISRSDL